MARRSTGRKTDFTWQGLFPVGNSTASGAAFVQLVVTTTTPATLYRSRGEIIGSIDGPADGNKLGLSFGLIVATEEQVAVGATALPNPAVDLDAEWIWHGFILLLSQAIVSTDYRLHSGKLQVDSKAMRRMKQGQSVVLVGQNTAVSGTPASDTVVAFRLLFGE